MKDNEIIKALECCNGFEWCPDECPYYTQEFKGTANCLDEKEGIMAKALDLINRQKAEIKQKDTEIDILIRKKETLRDEISELQRKNSELEIELTAMRGAANSYKRHYNNALREIERIVVMTVETAQKERERE